MLVLFNLVGLRYGKSIKITTHNCKNSNVKQLVIIISKIGACIVIMPISAGIIRKMPYIGVLNNQTMRIMLAVTVLFQKLCS